MATKIEVSQTSDNKIWVNGNLVIKDMNGQWIAQEELTPSEQRAFKQHLNSLKTVEDESD